MAQLELNGRTFRDIESYKAAKRDYDNIERIKQRTNLTDIEEVIKLRDTIEQGRYRFETMLGDDFLDELEELIKELKVSSSVVAGKKYNNGVKKKKSNAKEIEYTDEVLTKKELKAKTHKKEFDDYDEDMKVEIIRQLKRKEFKRKIFIAFMTLIALVSIGYLAFYYSMYAKNDMEYEALAKLKDESTKAVTTEYSINVETEDKTKPPILKKYETLYQKNKKLVGWIKIEDTKIDYPVMQTVNNDYYLDHNYNQEYDKNGSIFLDKDCDAAFPNDNLIIYGHHMKSGKMFGGLTQYAKESYYKDHPMIQFDTIYEEGTYQIMYVFRSRIYSEEEIVFKYYKFIDATSENEFYSNMEEMEKLSLYDTGVRAQYGDSLITLSTCDYEEANGRFVVVAKKIK